RSFIEQDWICRDRCVRLPRVLNIVQSNRDEVSGLCDAGPQPRILRNDRKLRDLYLAQPFHSVVSKERRAEVVADRTEISNIPIRIENPGPFLASWSVPY